MARPPKIYRGISVHIHLPEDLYAQLTAHLFSPSEGRVPLGAYQRFFSDRIIEFFSQARKPPL